jgi:hypothetical protein
LNVSTRTANIHGLLLPAPLVRALEEHRWRCPVEAILRRVFREKPVRAEFFDLATILDVNLRWRDERDPAFVGHPDPRAPPGDIDPTRSLLLGNLGPDLPFALDYRLSLDDPRVLYLHSGGDRWITVAPDIEQLLVRLQLVGGAERRPREADGLRDVRRGEG